MIEPVGPVEPVGYIHKNLENDCELVKGACWMVARFVPFNEKLPPPLFENVPALVTVPEIAFPCKSLMVVPEPE
jgi:hypothetical protein